MHTFFVLTRLVEAVSSLSSGPASLWGRAGAHGRKKHAR
jgi:hypothetical protein